MDIADLDLENIEALLENEKKDKKEKKKDKKKKKNQSKSRSKSHKQHSKSTKRRSRSRSYKKRSKDRPKQEQPPKQQEQPAQLLQYPQMMQQISQQVVMTEEEKNAKEKTEKIEIYQREIKQLEEKFQQAQQEAEEAAREDLTVMVYCLPSKAQEKDIYKFFTKAGCGKIRDIRLIKDQRSGRSKGVAYVEFFNVEGCTKALSLNNRPFQQNDKDMSFHEIKIQPSQAEKNRQAMSAKQLKQTKTDIITQTIPTSTITKIDGPMRIYVGNLVDQLAEVTDRDMRDMFEPFGEIDFVDIHKDMNGRCKGFAFIQYRNKEDAKVAIQKMNGYIIGEKALKVSTVTPGMNSLINQQNSQNDAVGALDLDEDNGANFLHTAQSRVSLMQKLVRNDEQIGLGGMHIQGMPMGMNPNMMSNPLLVSMNPLMAESTPVPTTAMPTKYILLNNMFSGDEVLKDRTFYSDLQEELEHECSKYGKIVQIFIDKNSQGSIYIQFQDPKQSTDCQKMMNNRWFNGKKITCVFIQDHTFRMRTG